MASSMGKEMVKEHILFIREASMLGNGRMGKEMVKEQKLYLMKENMKESGRMEKRGNSQNTAKTETT